MCLDTFYGRQIAHHGDAHKAVHDDIQAEITLIASRVTWYVTSQAFLLTGHATSWSANFVWPYFVHEIPPLLAIFLSIVMLASIYAATWAQDVYLREQTSLVNRAKSELKLSTSETIALESCERTMAAHRTNRSAQVVGNHILALVRIAPLVLPICFLLLWLHAYFCAPDLGRP